MNTDLSEDTLAYIGRVNHVRMAKMCRLCLEDKEILNINIDRDFRRLLMETLPDDRNFPQFICQDCRKVVEQMHRFSKRSTLASQLVQSFIAKGGTYPESSVGKRQASPDRDQNNPAKKQRTSLKSHVPIQENDSENIKLEPSSKTIDGESKKKDRRNLEAKRRNVRERTTPTKQCLSGCKSDSATKDDKGNIKLQPKETADGDHNKKDGCNSEVKQRNIQEECNKTSVFVDNTGKVRIIPKEAVHIKQENIEAGIMEEKKCKLEVEQKNVQDDYKMTKEYLFGSDSDSDSDFELRF